MNNLKPEKVLVFILLCFIPLSFIMLVWPENGVKISENIHLKFPRFQTLFSIDTTHYANIDGILNHKVDSNLLKELGSLEDSLKAFKEISASNPGKLNYPKNDKSVLYPFFEALEKVEDEGKSLRIMHYGDSQIEMDRITGYVREQLQNKFGGSGPGLQPPMQVISSTAIRQSNSGSWRRFASWGFDKSLRASHGRYGLMLNFCELSEGGGTVTFTTSPQSYSLAKNIQRVRVLVGNLESTFTGRLTADGKSYGERKAPAGNKAQLIEWELDTFPKSITISFSGGGTPEIYGIALDGKTGVSVDNLPMRGCSGTIFTRVDSTLLADSYRLMDVKLIIMEFGGNMMPSIKGEKNAEDYGVRFREQIRYIKSVNPDAAILVIGLADMSKKQAGGMQSYPYITNVRDVLKKATFDEGGTYWDMFEVMGGINSMPTWVNQGLAGKDYIHFTTKGAQKVSELFYEALMNDYNEYRLQKRIDHLNGPNPHSSVIPDHQEEKNVADTSRITEAEISTGKKALTFKKHKYSTEKKKKTKKDVPVNQDHNVQPEETSWVTYTVKKGDSLWKISAQFGVTVEDIVKQNNIDPDKIKEGQVLKIKKSS